MFRSKSPPKTVARPRGHRAWFPIGVLLLAILALVVLATRPELERNIQSWLVLIVVILSTLLLFFWLVFLSRLRWWTRLLAVALVILAGYGAGRILRIEGTTDGRGLPHFVWSWTPTRIASLPKIAEGAASVPPAAVPGLIDIPQFLGPNRDGTVPDAPLATNWVSHPPRELWRHPVGLGWSAFAVVGGRAYTQEQREEDECVSCYDLLTGRLLWTHANPTRFYQWQAGAGPHATPTVDGGQLFAYGASGLLELLNPTDGSRIWSRNILEENSVANLEWGTSASPLLVDELVVVTGGNAAGPTLLAYDRKTGEPRWKAGTDRASYASPVLATFNNRRVILSLNAATITAHDPATGSVLLSLKWGSDRPPKGAQPLPLPGDRLFVTAGYGMGCELFQITAAAEGQLTATSLWKNMRMKAQFNCVSSRGDYLYGLDDGQLACLETATGERKWKEGRYGSGQTLLMGDLIWIQSEPGDVILGQISPEGFKELGRLAALTSKTWNYPTPAGRYLLVRNDQEAVCYELAVTDATSAPEATPVAAVPPGNP